VAGRVLPQAGLAAVMVVAMAAEAPAWVAESSITRAEA
jgi:hypothetical protein